MTLLRDGDISTRVGIRRVNLTGRGGRAAEGSRHRHGRNYLRFATNEERRFELASLRWLAGGAKRRGTPRPFGLEARDNKRVFLTNEGNKEVNILTKARTATPAAPPQVDLLILATTGRFTEQRVQWIENHNHAVKDPRLAMWPNSHLELLLAGRGDLVEQFNLRPPAT